VVYVLVCSALFGPVTATSQVCVPDSYSFNSAGDYSLHRPSVLKCMKWLIKKPLHRKTELRSEVEAYCMEWLCGHPQLKAVLESSQVPYLDRNPQLLYVYLSKWTLLTLENPDMAGLERHLQSTRTVLKLASKSKGLAEDETLINLIRKWRRGDLAEWAEQTWKAGP